MTITNCLFNLSPFFFRNKNKPLILLFPFFTLEKPHSKRKAMYIHPSWNGEMATKSSIKWSRNGVENADTLEVPPFFFGHGMPLLFFDIYYVYSRSLLLVPAKKERGKIIREWKPNFGFFGGRSIIVYIYISPFSP